jgi:hypothetical protein
MKNNTTFNKETFLINEKSFKELQKVFEFSEQTSKKANADEMASLLSQIYYKNWYYKYSGVKSSDILIESHSKSLSEWTTEIKSKEQCLSKLIRESNLFDNFALRGDTTQVEAEHIKYLDNLSNMPNLEDIYVFVSENNSVESWFVVNQLSYEERLDYIEKEDDFCEKNSIEDYNLLIIEKKQLCVDKMPSPSYSFHKKEGCVESAQ